MDPQLDDEETRVGLRYILRQGLAGHAMGTLAGGVFMVEIALSLGASLFVIGPLAALPSLAQLAQLPATHLVERYRDRKRIAFLGLGGVRVCIFSIATIPLAVPTVVGPGGGLGLLLGLVALQGGVLGGRRDGLPGRQRPRRRRRRRALAAGRRGGGPLPVVLEVYLETGEVLVRPAVRRRDHADDG